MQHIYIITMKDVINLMKARKKENLSEDPADKTAPTEVVQASSPVDRASNIDG